MRDDLFKTYISYLLPDMYTYMDISGVRNVTLMENFAYILNA